MKRIFWLAVIATLILILGCCLSLKHQSKHTISFDCLDYFTQSELKCLKGTAWRCHEAGMTRSDARVMLRFCYQYNTMIVAERAYCLDDALDFYYEPVDYDD